MKLDPRNNLPSHVARRVAAFTLAEFQVSMAVILLVLGSVITANLYGLKMEQIVATKLNASSAARKALGDIVADIHSANQIQIGTGTASTFAALGNGVSQQGSAVRIYPTSSLSSWVIYYLDPADSKLKRSTNGILAAKVVAEYITNSVLFTSESYTGTVSTNSQNSRVIGVNLSFYQLPFTQASAGQSRYFDLYQLRTKVKKRL